MDEITITMTEESAVALARYFKHESDVAHERYQRIADDDDWVWDDEDEERYDAACNKAFKAMNDADAALQALYQYIPHDEQEPARSEIYAENDDLGLSPDW